MANEMICKGWRVLEAARLLVAELAHHATGTMAQSLREAPQSNDTTL